MSRHRALALFVPYMAVLLYLTVVDAPTPGPDPNGRLRLVPLQSIAYFWHRGGQPLAVNIVGNLAAFVPLGLLLPALRGPSVVTTLGHAALAGGGVSLAIEAIQYMGGRRVADVDDVILNLAGAVLGYVGFRAWAWGVRRWGHGRRGAAAR